MFFFRLDLEGWGCCASMCCGAVLMLTRSWQSRWNSAHMALMVLGGERETETETEREGRERVERGIMRERNAMRERKGERVILV